MKFWKRKKLPIHLRMMALYGVIMLIMMTADLGYVFAFGPGDSGRFIQRITVNLSIYLSVTGIYWVMAGAVLCAKRSHLLSERKVNMNEETMMTQSRLHAFSESFKKLSESFEEEVNPRVTLNQQEIQDIFNQITEQVCKDCSRCSYCWENVFEDSCETAYEILTLCEEKAEMQKKDLPKHFRQRCVRSDNFLAEAKRLTGLAKTNLFWQNKLALSRLAVAGQLGEVATVIGNFSEQIGEEPVKKGNLEKQIIRQLEAERISVRKIALYKKGNGRPCIYLEACLKKGDEQPLQRVIGIVSRICHCRYLPQAQSQAVINHKWQSYMLEADVQYRALVGNARMIRMGESISGDSYTILPLDTGQFVLSISDGMGSGQEAERESNRIISLLEQLLSSGFGIMAAIRLIHSVVLAGSDTNRYATLDLGVIDLYNGKCEMVKMGAAVSFIKNGDMVRMASNKSLPPGTLPEAPSEIEQFEMQDGDMLIMMSDGALGSLDDTDNEACVKTLIANCKETSPQEVADLLLNHAMARSHFEAEDDMTVLVCGIYRKPGYFV